jgi:hypothetical protein
VSGTTFQIVKGDLKPVLNVILQYEDGSAVNLTGANVNFQMSQNGVQLLNKPCTIINATSGQVQYQWQAGDTNYLGLCPAQFLVTFSDGTTQSFPTSQDFIVEFMAPPSVTGAPTPGYINVDDVQAALNATFDGTYYSVFGLSISPASMQAQTDYANAYIIGFRGSILSKSDSRYIFARQAAVDLAALRTLVIASGGSLEGAFDYFLGDLRIARAAPYATAIKNTIEDLDLDLQRQMMNFSTPAKVADAQNAQNVPTYRGDLVSP